MDLYFAPVFVPFLSVGGTDWPSKADINNLWSSSEGKRERFPWLIRKLVMCINFDNRSSSYKLFFAVAGPLLFRSHVFQEAVWGLVILASMVLGTFASLPGFLRITCSALAIKQDVDASCARIDTWKTEWEGTLLFEELIEVLPLNWKCWSHWSIFLYMNLFAFWSFKGVSRIIMSAVHNL